MIVSVKLGKELFSFSSHADWVATARRKFIKARSEFSESTISETDVICIDSIGRVCLCGKQFSRAETEGTYPITAFKTLCEDKR